MIYFQIRKDNGELDFQDVENNCILYHKSRVHCYDRSKQGDNLAIEFFGRVKQRVRNDRLHSNIMCVIHLVMNIIFYARTKHIQLMYYFIHTLLEGRQIFLEKIHTTKRYADMLTKIITQEKLKLRLALVEFQ